MSHTVTVCVTHVSQVCINGGSGFGVTAISIVALCLCSCSPRFTRNCTGLHQNRAVLQWLSGWAGHDVTVSNSQKCRISRPHTVIDINSFVLHYSYSPSIYIHTIVCSHIIISIDWSCRWCFEHKGWQCHDCMRRMVWPASMQHSPSYRCELCMRQVTVLKIHVLHIKLSQTHHLLCVGKFFGQTLRVTLCSGVHE